MATERQSPDGLLGQSNLAGVIGDIQDDPDSPDGNWLDAVDVAIDTICRASFPTPIGNPTAGVGLQEFKVWVKRVGGANNPQVDIDLYENGVLVSSVIALTEVTNGSGEIFAGTWDAGLLSNSDGSWVEIRVYGKRSGGSPTKRATVSVGAVEWNVTYTEVGAKTTQYLAGNDCPVFPHGMDLQSDKLPCPPPYD